MTELVITRGYPASGKTTWAKRLAGESGWARVCRDDLRAMLFGGEGVLAFELEARITAVEQAQVEALLKAGCNVVVDATNLRLKYARAWADLALKLGADFTVEDFAAVSVDECVRRDAARGAGGGRMVGEQVIRDMAVKFPVARWETVTARVREDGTAPARYLPDTSLPDAYLVDVDGTLAKMNGRGPFDWDRVGEDEPVMNVVRVVNRLAFAARIIVMSGRDEQCRGITEDWLQRHGIHYDELHMRPARDQRKDSVVKAELFDKHIRHRFHVRGVFDDRDQVVRMWREIGLQCFQVAEGDF